MRAKSGPALAGDRSKGRQEVQRCRIGDPEFDRNRVPAPTLFGNDSVQYTTACRRELLRTLRHRDVVFLRNLFDHPQMAGDDLLSLLGRVFYFRRFARFRFFLEFI
jgi:hypothetical protein